MHRLVLKRNHKTPKSVITNYVTKTSNDVIKNVKVITTNRAQNIPILVKESPSKLKIETSNPATSNFLGVDREKNLIKINRSINLVFRENLSRKKKQEGRIFQ